MILVTFNLTQPTQAEVLNKVESEYLLEVIFQNQ
jgi:hypothetical protein